MTPVIDWPVLPAGQQPRWPDAAALDRAQARLATLPPLVFAGESDILREQLAKVARGQAFVLMGGDCAETFAVDLRSGGEIIECADPRPGLDTCRCVSLGHPIPPTIAIGSPMRTQEFAPLHRVDH